MLSCKIHDRSTHVGEHLLCQHWLTRYVHGEITGLFSHAVLGPEYLPRRRLAQSLLAPAMLLALLLLLDRSCGLQLIRHGSSGFQLLIDRLVECGGADVTFRSDTFSYKKLFNPSSYAKVVPSLPRHKVFLKYTSKFMFIIFPTY
jgi:hypothetical protein